MKRLISILLIAVFMLTACSSDGDEKHISAVVFEELCAKYTGGDISDYRVISALVNAGETLVGYTYSPETPDGRTESDGEYLLSLYFAKKGGIDTSNYETAKYLSKTAERISSPDDLSAYEIFLCTAVLKLYGEGFDSKAVVRSLEKRQDEIRGGFYDYIPKGGEKIDCNADASAYAYMTYVMLRSDANDFNIDNALIYLGNTITDDNTICDAAGKSSCLTTATVLTALLSSGIPTDGEISTALFTAINGFAVGGRYTEYKNGSVSKNVDAAVLLCASTAIHGNPYTKIEGDDNEHSET